MQYGNEKCEIGMKTTDILRKLNRDHRTVKRFVSDSEHRRVRQRKAYEGTFMSLMMLKGQL